MTEQNIQRFIELSDEDIQNQLLALLKRSIPQASKRQEKFNPVEVLLCYGLFEIVDPHKFGSRNAADLPSEVKKLATFFKRPATSLTSKMLNLDGSLAHSGKEEVALYAYLASQPQQVYRELYSRIIRLARNLDISSENLADYLMPLPPGSSDSEYFLGQEELPASTATLLQGQEQEFNRLQKDYELAPLVTEKLLERRVRLGQHRFAQAVLANYAYTCVFCGFNPQSLLPASGLLRASHIKPWAVSSGEERLNMQNGLVACPTHDAAFDEGYLTVETDFTITISHLLQASIASDPKVSHYFSQEGRSNNLHQKLQLPATARTPAGTFLTYHRENVFKG